MSAEGHTDELELGWLLAGSALVGQEAQEQRMGRGAATRYFAVLSINLGGGVRLRSLHNGGFWFLLLNQLADWRQPTV